MTEAPRPVSARPVLVVGAVAAANAGALAVLSVSGRGALGAMLLVSQVAFVVAWTLLLDIPGPTGAIAIAAGAAAASDGALLKAHHVSLTDFATIVALAFLLSLVWQIARPARTRVTESLAATLAATVFAVAGGAWLTLRSGVNGQHWFASGQQATAAALIGVTSVLGLGRLVDAVLPRPRLSGSRRRGLPGLVVGVAAAIALGAVYGAQADPHLSHVEGLFYGAGVMTAGKAGLIALVAALVAAVVDLGIDAGLATLSGDRQTEPPRRLASWPARLVVLAVLPALIAAPPAYVVAKAVLT